MNEMKHTPEKQTITVDIGQAVQQLQANPELATMMMELVAPTAAKDIDRLVGICSGLLTALAPLAALPIGPEIIEDVDLVLYSNAGRCITVGDVLAARSAIASAEG